METDCRSDVGITVGLIDGIIAICRVLAQRDLQPDEVREALLDLASDEDLEFIISQGRLTVELCGGQ